MFVRAILIFNKHIFQHYKQNIHSLRSISVLKTFHWHKKHVRKISKIPKG